MACHENDAERAKKLYSEAIAIFPDNKNALFRRAVITLKSGDEAVALKDLEKAIEASPG